MVGLGGGEGGGGGAVVRRIRFCFGIRLLPKRLDCLRAEALMLPLLGTEAAYHLVQADELSVRTALFEVVFIDRESPTKHIRE